MPVLEVLTQQQSLERHEESEERRLKGDVPEVVDENEQFLVRLDSHVRDIWSSARMAKESDIQERMLEDLRQREGEYDADKLQAIRAMGGSEIFMMLTSSKCRTAEGWLRDTLLPAGERPFSVEATPIPDIPEDQKADIVGMAMAELQAAIASGSYPTQRDVYNRARQLYDDNLAAIREAAEKAANRMEDKIDDIYVEGGWYDALEDMLSDLVALPSAFLKGPCIQRKKRLKWGVDGKGKRVPMVEDELVPVYYSPSPLDIFPAANAKDIDDGPLCERIKLRRSAIESMRGVDGYSTQKIELALQEYQRTGFDLMLAGDQERKDLENNRNYQTSVDNTIDCIEVHCEIRGEMLLEWGVKNKKVTRDPAAEYPVTVLLIGRFVVRVSIKDDPLGRRPYMMASFDRIKGQFWGKSLSRLIRDLQAMCNACARALSNNMGLASGPMVEVEVDRLADGEDPTKMHPWRLFQTKSSRTASPGPAVRFHNPPDIMQGLLSVYTYFSGLADNYSGIPSYEQGINQTNGAAGTASGLSMLMGAASRQVKRLVAAIDKCIKGTTERTHTHVMLYDKDEDVKGDIAIKARGASALMVKEQQQMRRMELLRSTQNEIDAPLMGPEGRSHLLREAMRSMDINSDDVLPSEDEQRAKIMQEALAQAQAAMQPGGQGQPMTAPAQLPGGMPAGGQQNAQF
jgi:hypothetical protein